MRILFVGMPYTVHSPRWIRQVTNVNWDLHFFPSDHGTYHRDLLGIRELTRHDRFADVEDHLWHWLTTRQWPVHRRGVERLRRVVVTLAPRRMSPAWRLARTIERLRPDVVHAMEIQHAGYLVLAARALCKQFPPFMVSNWGSDIVLFGRLAAHADRIRAVMQACDFYTCECKRDVMLARVFGFRGEVLPVVPISGGYDVARLQALARPGRVSERRTLVIKGYQHWAGRGLVALQALRYCADALRDYTVKVYLAGTEDVRIAAELVGQDTGLQIELTPFLKHDDMLKLHGQSRVSVALSISDGISHSLMEAMMMGAFPIQSNTACAGEWLRDGEDGILVEPEDARSVAVAIRRAVSDDDLVDRAAVRNMQVTRERLDCSVIGPLAVGMYEKAKERRRTE